MENRLKISLSNLSRIIGHVPKELASIFSCFLAEKHADCIIALCTGQIVNEAAVPGGGVKLGCIYMLHTSDKSRPFYLSKKLNKYVPDARAHVFFDSIDHILAI